MELRTLPPDRDDIARDIKIAQRYGQTREDLLQHLISLEPVPGLLLARPALTHAEIEEIFDEEWPV